MGSRGVDVGAPKIGSTATPRLDRAQAFRRHMLVRLLLLFGALALLAMAVTTPGYHATTLLLLLMVLDKRLRLKMLMLSMNWRKLIHHLLINVQKVISLLIVRMGRRVRNAWGMCMDLMQARD